MKQIKRYLMIGYIAITLCVIAIIVSYIMLWLYVLLIAIFALLISVFGLIIVHSLTPFILDKQLDIAALKAEGLTIVTCPKCHKHNVLEDQYCIFCHSQLIGDKRDDTKDTDTT
ncbi:MAG: DUF2614 family zinc ribbon-containing protein [Candidatus Izemoplasma sp.]|nr:DUF2614 family zinc ribbon-containing protein [Candidatus Izemoplasma sp.]